MKTRALIAAAFAVTALSAGAVAANATTGPGQRVNILVIVNDKHLFVYDQAQMARGAIATFQVFNSGKKTHGYSLLGKQTGPIKPKHWKHFTVILLTRGRFPDGSPFDKGPSYHGYFTVY
ncbi:MAG: hypothetical protein JO064_08575 [Actinobacteria bacterium]|nr:hypothetical protein [Actinomycetota bacterium]